MIVSDLVPDSPDGGILLVQSLRRAAAARLLAEALEMPNKDVCFSTGLLLEIERADVALYQAKAAGRNQVIPAT